MVLAGAFLLVFPLTQWQAEQSLEAWGSCPSMPGRHWIHVMRQLLGAWTIAVIFFAKVNSDPEVDSCPALLVVFFYAEWRSVQRRCFSLPEAVALGNWTFFPRAFASGSPLSAVLVLPGDLPQTEFESG